MSWSAPSWFVAFFVALVLGLGGCGGPNLPPVRSQGDHEFMTRQRGVATVDVLPLDVQLWTHAKSRTSPEAQGEQFHALASGAVTAELSRRGYQVVAQMDWDGSYVLPGGAPAQAMTPETIEVTAHSLSGYGRAVAAMDDALPVPYLPHRLGTATGADATLYVGGWAYVGNDNRQSTGVKVAKGVAIGILIVAVIAVVIVAAGKGGGGGGGGVASGAGKVAAGAGRVAVTAGRVAGRVTAPVMRGVARSGPQLMRGVLRTADAFGRAGGGTHLDIYAGRPAYFEEPGAPKSGRSRMHLEMTLIDNRTGLVLWHTGQTFPANGTRSKHVRDVVSRLMASLPQS
jgi:hypothetical protein